MDHTCFKLESMFRRLYNHTHGQRLACSFEIFELPLSLDQKAQTQPWSCKLPVTPIKLPVATRVGEKKTCHQCCTIFFYFGHRPFRNASVWTSNGLNLLELHAVSLLQVFISAKCKWDKPGKNDVRFQHATGKTQQ